MALPSPIELRHAYRHLYRGLLHAVQFSKPARYVARNQLRTAFRNEEPTSFNAYRIERTVEFLRLAAQETGMEHKILKNLLHVAWTQRQHPSKDARDRKAEPTRIRKTAMIHYEMTIAMLNDTLVDLSSQSDAMTF